MQRGSRSFVIWTLIFLFPGYITANYQFIQDELTRVAPGCTPVRRRRGSQSQTPAKRIRNESGAPITIDEYAQELIEGELAQRLFQVTQKIHKKLPEHVRPLFVFSIRV